MTDQEKFEYIPKKKLYKLALSGMKSSNFVGSPPNITPHHLQIYWKIFEFR